MAAPVRVVQVTDTHLSAAVGVPAQWRELLAFLRADPPDLVVHTGDIVLADPDDEADRAFARRLLDQIPAPLTVIPGNHDVGFYGEQDHLPRRLEAFVTTYGSDRFVLDLGAWRLVGVDAYLLGRDDPLGRTHDAWFAAAVIVDRPTAVFVHQPPLGDLLDGWQMPDRASAAFREAIAGRDVRVVASGHRHCAGRWTVDGRPTVWAPSLTLVSGASAPWLVARGGQDVKAATGIAELVLHPDGHVDHRTVTF